MTIRTMWNWWRLLMPWVGSGFGYMSLIRDNVMPWIPMSYLWVFLGALVLLIKCRCPECRKFIILFDGELSPLTLFYWAPDKKVKCINCGRLIGADDNI